jgi:UDP-N-acetylmuramoyl-L-alanyl-D-glutamate--2,6-diaminopimelate ligase
MKLGQLLELAVGNENELEISGLNTDSRSIKPGEVFCAIAGDKWHGKEFIHDAIAQGAVAVLNEADNNKIYTINSVLCVDIPDLTHKLGWLAARFHHYPSQNMHITGVTGTNGKTSVTQYIAQLLPEPCAVIGTLGYGILAKLQVGNFTTPPAIQLQALLAQFRQQAIQQVAMEVSSHALQQGRINGVEFDSVVFTNLSRDHLDYHKSMQDYKNTKAKLFRWPGLKTAILNQDDPHSNFMRQQLATNVNCLNYSISNNKAELYAQILQEYNYGYLLNLHTPWGRRKIELRLLGEFNVSNILAAAGVVLSQGLSLDELAMKIPRVRAVNGRMQCLTANTRPMVIIDYAHTPDALQKLLIASRKHCSGQLYCVFGCGGERDQGKRAQMGNLAEQLADKIIITDDNPRHEESAAIIADILKGCHNLAQIQIIPERALAIHAAIEQANINDVVVIAGKGHENYQQVKDVRLPFSDVEVVSQIFAN